MPVELIFNAPDVEALHQQVIAYAHALQPVWAIPAVPDPEDSKYRSPLVEPAPPADIVAETFLAGEPVDSGENPKPRRKHRRTKDLADTDVKTPTKTDVSVSEPQPEPQPEPQVEEPPEDDLIVPTPASDAPSDTVANEKLKSEVVSQLHDLFAAGKVKQLRGILDKYGGGAKSFPEIDATHFPLIKKAMAAGEFT